MSEKKQIIKIQVQKKNDFKLFFDDQSAFIVDEATIARFNLRKDIELDDTLINEIAKFQEVLSAKKIAYKFLDHHLRTKKQIIIELKRNDIDNLIIAEVISELEKEKYIDDIQYAKSFVNTQIKTTENGPRIISKKLFSDGIDKSIIENQLEAFDTNQQLTKLEKIIQKSQLRHRNDSNQQMKIKTTQLLFSKGFESEIIQQAMDFFFKEESYDHELEMVNKQLKKIWDKYEKYGEQRQYRAKQYLFSKGFSKEIIEEVISDNK